MATPIPENDAAFSVEQLFALLKPLANEAARELSLSARALGVCTDTRVTLAGKLFVALSGERFDGHRFLREAHARGAFCAVVEREVEDAPPGLPLLLVNSTLDALATLAHAHRRIWNRSLVAVAGSAGKTTTRSLITALLKQLRPGKVHFPAGNLNNRIGVPMVLFGLAPEHEYAVIEIGTNQPGEVAALARAAAPEFGVLTLIDLEHSEGLGGLDGVEQEESELFTYTAERAIGNGDDPRVRRQVSRHEKRCATTLYGFDSHNGYRAVSATLKAEYPTTPVGEAAERVLCMVVTATRPDGTELTFHTPFIGTPGVLSSLAALACVETLLGVRVSSEQLEAAFFQPAARQPGRLEPHQLSDGTLVIDDSYNANPASVLAGLSIAKELAAQRGSALHAVLGEMRELGDWAEAEHRRVGAELPRLGLASLTAVGGYAQLMLSPLQKNATFVLSAELALNALRPHLAPGDVVFVKASRGIAAERVVRGLLDGTAPNKEATDHS